MAKKEVPEDEGPSQEWLASYADAMTLLLAFFIMMFAFALIDEGKFFDFKVGVVAALGIPDPLTDNTDSILEKGSGISPEVGLTPLTPSESQELSMSELLNRLQEAGEVTEENAEELRELLELEVEVAGAAEFVEVGIDERGVFIRFTNRVLFNSGSADLENEGLLVLAKVANVLDFIDNYLEVEGHTDSQPTNGGAWPSNWELSAVRASGVVRFMIDPGGIPAERLLAMGLADTNPIASNNTAEGRQENRRVEIVVRLNNADAEQVAIITEQVDGDGDGSIDGIDESTGGDFDSEATPEDVVVEPGAEGTGDGDGEGAAGGESIDPIGDPIGLPTTPEG